MKKFLLYFFAIFMGALNVTGSLTFAETVNFYCDTYFYDSGTEYYNAQETIEYTSYTMEEVYIANGIPNYKNSTQANSCAPMAGCILICYYDYYYPNLVPNFATGYVYNNNFYYRQINTQINGIKETLYDLMGTNSINPGTSLRQFKQGITSYANQQGYSVSYSSYGKCNNISNVKASFTNNAPLVVFLNSYDYTPFYYYTITDTKMELTKRVSANGHVAVAYGYREYKFYNNQDNFRTDKYLLISFGNGTQGMLNIKDTSKLDETLGVNFS